MNLMKFAAGAKSVAAASARPVLMESVSAGAVILSAGLAAIGVSGLVGWNSELAIAGSVALIAGTLLTETAAARLPVHAEARAREPGLGGKLKAMAAVGGFIVLTGWNVTAGHMGMKAIDNAGRADALRPLSAALEAARAEEGAAVAAEAAAREAAYQSAKRWHESMAAVPAGWLRAGDRRQREADAAAERQAAAVANAASVTAAAKAKRQASEEAIAALPPPRPDRELWGFTLVLELLKGLLVWFATAAERRSSRPLAARVDAVSPALKVLLARVDELARDEIDALASLGGSISATVRQARRRAAFAA